MTATKDGRIRIGLGLAGGRVAKVRIDGRGAETAAAAFAGMPAADLPRRIGAVFALCGRAQTIAALQAIEAASEHRAPAGVAAARDLLRLAEMLTQTAMRLALRWPPALGLDPDPEPVRACLTAERDLERALFAGPGWRRPGAGVALSGDPAAILDRLDGAMARFLAGNRLAPALSAAGLDGFGALPDGMAPEQGALARQWDAPPVAARRADHGAGLAARLAAGLVELTALPAAMRGALARLAPVHDAALAPADGSGAATVETARGPLTHQVEAEAGVIAACRIDAPTEANFRPGGPVEAGLVGAGTEDLDRAARLHLLAIDPCVEFVLEVSDA